MNYPPPNTKYDEKCGMRDCKLWTVAYGQTFKRSPTARKIYVFISQRAFYQALHVTLQMRVLCPPCPYTQHVWYHTRRLHSMRLLCSCSGNILVSRLSSYPCKICRMCMHEDKQIGIHNPEKWTAMKAWLMQSFMLSLYTNELLNTKRDKSHHLFYLTSLLKFSVISPWI